MPQLKTVLCPIDFSGVADRELAVAVEVCEAFGAHLVLHHNLAAVAPGFTRAWEWNEVHRAEEGSTPKAEERLRKILAGIPKTVSAEASISHGPLATVLLQLAGKLPADLVILGSHGWSTDEHASVTERIIDRCPCPVLTVHESDEPVPEFRLRSPATVVVPTDFSAGAETAVDYAFDMARQLPFRLHLLHVVAGGDGEATRRLLKDIIPPDLADRTEVHVEHGDPIAQVLNCARRLDAHLVVMGEHARGFLRRFFTKHTAREVLHRASCPVWFVPPHP